MSEPFLGEIRMFGGTFAPVGWAFCDGSLLTISDNDALFNLIGTTYGGDGQSTFALPDLRGRFMAHTGNNGIVLGGYGGSETVTLTVNQMPAHTHGLRAKSGPGDDYRPAGRYPAADGANATQAYSSNSPDNQLAANAISPAGSNQPHENMPPFVAIHFIIAVQGIYPSQN